LEQDVVAQDQILRCPVSDETFTGDTIAEENGLVGMISQADFGSHVISQKRRGGAGGPPISRRVQ